MGTLKALITYDANKISNKIVAEESYRVIQVIVDDYGQEEAYFESYDQNRLFI